MVVPTTQIFLNNNETLGTQSFDPYQQKTIYNYTRRDIKKEIKIPRGLFIKMIEDLEYNSGLSKMELQQKRNAKSLLWNGS